MRSLKVVPLVLFISTAFMANAQAPDSKLYHELYRPQVHFSPQAHWINDPNGMVYYNGIYHLFFQYYPNGTTWGPMHWGHAESKDLIHWQERPIALYPDSLGYIFSGSAVADVHNTSGFGKGGKVPLVAIFTNHDPAGEKAGKNNFQNQSLAYSLNNGATWTKYPGNPVLKNTGIRDFRDPKVIWYAAAKKWIMTLATQDHITFFSSPNLKDWQHESEFGKQLGAHGGVWECPDMFPMQLNGITYWLLIVNVNPGGVNGGSATQYFVGKFDGNKFTPVDSKIRWVDFGPDEYAGVTWSNTANRHLFLGWMSNWTYANQVPTEKWRNAMTIPRELTLKEVDGEVLLSSMPVKEMAKIASAPLTINIAKLVKTPAQYILAFSMDNLKDFSIELGNVAGEKLVFGYDEHTNKYFIDRSKSGRTDFNPAFAQKSLAPRLATGNSSAITMIVDASSIEVFADDGLSVMTSLFFPQKPYNHVKLTNNNGTVIKSSTLTPLKSIWP